MSFLRMPDPLAEGDASEILEADVVVIGLGNAGTIASIVAAEMGAKVIVFQKTEGVYTFGNAVAFPNSKIMASNGVINDDPWSIVNDIQRGLCQNHSKTKLWQNWVKYGEEIGNWWIDKVGDNQQIGPILAGPAETVDADNPWNQTYAGTHLPQAANAQTDKQPYALICEIMLQDALESGLDIDVHYSTPAIQLLTDETGRVIGAFGKNAEGVIILAKASKGIILATGGYSGNDAMRSAYMPIWKDLPTAQPDGIENGDGILMGYWAGGKIEDAPHSAAVHYDPKVGLPSYFGDVVPFLRVNLNGERFSNEDMGYALMPLQDALQPEGCHFQVFDDNYAEDSLHMGQGSMFGDWATMIPQAVEAGEIYTGNTIEELGEAIGVPVDVFVREVERYNELCDKGYDEDFGKQAGRLKPVRKSPFYAFKRRGSILATLSGLDVDENYNVLREDRTPIDGLYAVGNDSGGMFGGINYPLNLPGVSVGRAILSGCIAAWRACGRDE